MHENVQQLQRRLGNQVNVNNHFASGLNKMSMQFKFENEMHLEIALVPITIQRRRFKRAFIIIISQIIWFCFSMIIHENIS